MPIPDWPKGPSFYAEQHMRPYFPAEPPSLLPYSAWGAMLPTTVWTEAGRCGGASQGGDSAYFAELLAERNTPTEARPYLERGDWPPTPGTRAYSYDIKPQFVDRMDEQHYIDWWYAHFTSDAPRYTLPPLPPVSEGPNEPPVRPPRDWPTQEPRDEPDEPTTTITTTGPPTTAEEPSRTPWGWIVGGSAALLLIGGGVAYVVTRPKRRRDGGRRRRRRR